MHNRLSRRAFVRSVVCAMMFGAGCSDSLTPPLPASNDAEFAASEGRGVLHRYVAIGTSISMGWTSDGVLAASQRTSWPVQLAQLGGRDLTTPDLDYPGCRSPLAAPLANATRLSGEPAALDPSLFACAPLVQATVLPTQNLAISTATTFDALYVTPELQHDPFYSKLYPRVLPPGMTQVSAMMAQNPKLVSVELGGNEVLNARDGAAVEGQSMYPYAAWAPLYDAVLDSVQKTAKLGVVVGLTDDVREMPAFRSGAELWNDHVEFAQFNVVVSQDCKASDNLLFVPVRVPLAVGAGAARLAAKLGPYTLSCAASPDKTAKDYVLDPDEAHAVNDLMARMDAHIRAEAGRREFAYFRLGDLYERADVKPPFSVAALMGSNTPYGPLIGLDGIHPSAAGSTVLADAAARALNARYGLGIPVSASFLAANRF